MDVQEARRVVANVLARYALNPQTADAERALVEEAVRAMGFEVSFADAVERLSASIKRA